MNSALIVEECYREAKDNNIDFQPILLDVKAAFDTVVQSHAQESFSGRNRQ
jgi:hypothetical protein